MFFFLSLVAQQTKDELLKSLKVLDLQIESIQNADLRLTSSESRPVVTQRPITEHGLGVGVHRVSF